MSPQLTVLKAIHVKWIYDCHANLQTKQELIRFGFRKEGSLESTDSDADTEPLSDSESSKPVVMTISDSYLANNSEVFLQL